MAPHWPTVFLVLLAATNAQRPSMKEWKEKQAAAKSKAAAHAADEGKTAAVDKVVSLLETLRNQVQAEGEAEAKSYNKFACFCKENQIDRTKRIGEETDIKAELSASITSLSEGRAEDDADIAEDEKDIAETETEMDTMDKDNVKAMKTHAAEKADLSFAIESIGNALKTLKASQPSLLQLKTTSNSVREAVAMADALGFSIKGHGFAGAFLQGADVPMENYKFHSSGVIETLEGLQDEFRKKKDESDTTEAKRLRSHDIEYQTKTDHVTAKEVEVADTTKSRADKVADIASTSGELTTDNKDLLSDQDYLEDLYEMCQQKATTYDERTKVRTDELSALTAAITIVSGAVREKTSSATIRFAQRGVTVKYAEAFAHDDSALEAIEEAAEETEAAAAPTFLQKLSRKAVKGDEKAVDMVSKLLRSTKSTLLTGLAAQIYRADGKPKGMEKVKTLVEELVKRLQAEAENEATQKGWCDESTNKAKAKRAGYANEISKLNDRMAKLEADRDMFEKEIRELTKDIQESNEAQEEADNLRSDENAENKATIKEAQEGQEAVEDAIKILSDFYNANADNKDVESKDVAADVDASFKGGEAYKGHQAAGDGVLSMLDVIRSDFVRTIEETTKGEEQSLKDYKVFTDKTQKIIKEKTEIKTKRETELDETKEEHANRSSSLDNNMKLLQGVIKELLELKASCVDTGMSYEDRVAAREQELGSLKKALCILSNFGAYGPEGEEIDQC